MTRTTIQVLSVAAATIGVLLLGSCAADPSGSPEVDDGSTSADARTTAPGDPGDTPSRSDLRDEVDLDWTRAEVVDDTHVRVFFVGDTPRCHGIRATVEESADTITIVLRQGTLPDAPEACEAVAYQGSTLVTLRDPVGDRAIVPAR
jgi:hypothetical protein